jgi:hypothetical protein
MSFACLIGLDSAYCIKNAVVHVWLFEITRNECLRFSSVLANNTFAIYRVNVYRGSPWTWQNPSSDTTSASDSDRFQATQELTVLCWWRNSPPFTESEDLLPSSNSLPRISILSHLNPVYTNTACLFRIYFNIILTTSSSLKWCLRFRVSDHYFVCFSHFLMNTTYPTEYIF